MQSLHYYMLDENHNVVKTTDTLKWGEFMMDFSKHVVRQEVYPRKLDNGMEIFVSTVFLGIDHRFYGEGKPLLFESMVFVDGKSDDHYWRETSWENAIERHEKIMRAIDLFFKVKDSLPDTKRDSLEFFRR